MPCGMHAHLPDEFKASSVLWCSVATTYRNMGDILHSIGVVNADMQR